MDSESPHAVALYRRTWAAIQEGVNREFIEAACCPVICFPRARQRYLKKASATAGKDSNDEGFPEEEKA